MIVGVGIDAVDIERAERMCVEPAPVATRRGGLDSVYAAET